MNSTTSTDLALCFCTPDHCGKTAAEGCVTAKWRNANRAAAKRRLAKQVAK